MIARLTATGLTEEQGLALLNGPLFHHRRDYGRKDRRPHLLGYTTRSGVHTVTLEPRSVEEEGWRLTVERKMKNFNVKFVLEVLHCLEAVGEHWVTVHFYQCIIGFDVELPALRSILQSIDEEHSYYVEW